MNETEFEQQLRKEGYTLVYVVEDGPNKFYRDHTHPTITAHIILDGEMRLVLDGTVHELKKLDRLDVPSGTIHSAKMGVGGCRYMVGEK